MLLITLKSVVVRELKAVWVLMGPCCRRSESASAGQRRHTGGSGRAGPAAGGPAELSAAEVCDQSERIEACWLFKEQLHQESVLIPAERSGRVVVECSMFCWFSLTQDQLTSTGGVWQVCDQFAQLPKGQFVSRIFTLLSRKVLKIKYDE